MLAPFSSCTSPNRLPEETCASMGSASTRSRATKTSAASSRKIRDVRSSVDITWLFSCVCQPLQPGDSFVQVAVSQLPEAGAEQALIGAYLSFLHARRSEGDVAF